MMPISLQPSVTPASIDGLSAQSQSRDSETIQALSFEDALKVEEKKLQLEQETNALSVAAAMAMMQPTIKDTNIKNETIKTAGPTNPKTAPAQSTSASPQQDAPSNSKAATSAASKNTNKKTGAKIAVHVQERTTAAQQSAPKVAVTREQHPVQPAISTTSKAINSTAPQTDLSFATVAKTTQPAKKTDIPTTQGIAPEIKPTASKQINVAVNNAPQDEVQTKIFVVEPKADESKQANVTGNDVPQAEVQVKPFVAEPKPAKSKQANVPVNDAPKVEVKAKDFVTTTPIIEVDVRVEKESSNHIPLSADEDSMLTQSETPRSQRTLPQSDISKGFVVEPKAAESKQTNVTVNDDPQVEVKAKDFVATMPMAEVDVPVEKESSNYVTLSADEGSMPTQPETLRSQRTLPQSDMSNGIIAEPKAAESKQANVTVNNAPQVEVQVKPFVAEPKPAESKQVNVTVNEAPQAEIKAKDFVANTPSVEVNVPVEKESSSRITLSADQGSMPSQPETLRSQRTLPQSDMPGDVEPDLPVRKLFDNLEIPATLPGMDNAAGESRLGSMIKPKVSDEASAFEQKNVTAKIKPETVALSGGAEIKLDEKIQTKEIDREFAADLESNVVISGVDKGSIGVKAAEKPAMEKINTAYTDVIQQITSQMKARIKGGETTMRIRLNPVELGAIDVQLVHNAQGLSVSFITEQATTGQLIESQASQLRQSLKDAGVQLTNLNISQHQQSNQEGGSFKQSQQFVPNQRRDVPQVETSNEERMRPQRIGGSTSEIDYLI